MFVLVFSWWTEISNFFQYFPPFKNVCHCWPGQNFWCLVYSMTVTVCSIGRSDSMFTVKLFMTSSNETLIQIPWFEQNVMRITPRSSGTSRHKRSLSASGTIQIPFIEIWLLDRVAEWVHSRWRFTIQLYSWNLLFKKIR